MTAKMRLMVRVAKRRVAGGEDINDILNGWPALTDDEKNIIRKAVKG